MAKKKEENAAVETEETKAKFREKLKSLLELGKKKRNILEYQEISDFFRDMNLDEEKMEKVLDFLEANKVDVLRISDGDDEDDDIILDDEDEVEVEKIDLSVPEGVSVEDPVRMYLKEIGKVPLQTKKLSWHRRWRPEVWQLKKFHCSKSVWQKPVMNRKKKKYKRRSKHCNWMSTVDQMPKNVWRRQIFVW